MASPWISASYIALASLIYTVLLMLYVIQLLYNRHRKRLMASKPFSFDAATVALLSNATKIPSVTTSAPPGHFDHLLRLSGALLFCITMNLSLPALGFMDGSSIVSNMAGLIIFLTIEVFNLYSVRLGTPYHTEEKLFSAVMMFTLAVFISHSLTVTTVRRRIENELRFKYDEMVPKKSCKSCGNDAPEYTSFSFDKLRGDLEKYWLMAATSNPNWTLWSCGVPMVCSILTWGVIFAVFLYRVAILVSRDGIWRSYVRDDYQRFPAVVFFIDVVAIAIGGMASFFQGLHSNPVLSKFMRPCTSIRLETITEALFVVAEYRIQMLIEWREEPLSKRPRTRVIEMVLRNLKILLVNSVKLAHLAVKYACNLVLTTSALVVFIPFKFLHRWGARGECFDTHELKEFDLRLGLDAHERVRSSWLRFPRRWIQIGSKKKPRELIKLIEKHAPETSEKGVKHGYEYSKIRLYSRRVPMIIQGEQPPHSWTLTILTLAKVIDANFHKAQSDDPEVKQSLRNMRKAVHQCVKFSRLVDLNVGPAERSDAEALRKAVDMVSYELDLDLRSRWFDIFLDLKDIIVKYGPLLLEDLVRLKDSRIPKASESSDAPSRPPFEEENKDEKYEYEDAKKDKESLTPTTSMKEIEDKARKNVEDLIRRSPRERNPGLLAANCLYRISASLCRQVRPHRSTDPPMDASSMESFLSILERVMIACLSRLPLALVTHCSGGTLEEKEDRVREATIALGEAKEILEAFEGGRISLLDNAFEQYEDDWHGRIKSKRQS